MVFINGKDAFSIAFNEYTDTVYRVAFHNCSNSADAQEITQDVFVKLLEHTKPFYSSEHLKAWLIRVTVNACRDRHKKHKHEELSDKVVSIQPEENSSMLDAVKALPENYRNAIYLHYYEGYTAKEIGKLLGAKQSTVLSWLSRGRQALKADLTEEYNNE